jgi:hypothetical protein
MFHLLDEYHILPREYLALDTRSKAFLAACLYIKADEYAEQKKKLKRGK